MLISNLLYTLKFFPTYIAYYLCFIKSTRYYRTLGTSVTKSQCSLPPRKGCYLPHKIEVSVGGAEVGLVPATNVTSYNLEIRDLSSSDTGNICKLFC